MSDTSIRVSGKRLTNTILGLARHRVAAAIATLMLLPWVAPYEALSVNILLFGLYAVGFNLVFGYTGMLSFGHAAFFGVGAYACGIAIATFDVNGCSRSCWA
jgi:branched-chain amino acid transport system permease protein